MTTASPRPTSATRRFPTRSTCAARGTRSPTRAETASCVGWTVADSLVRWHLVEAGRLEPDEQLSARYVWMAAKEWFQRETFPSTFLETDGTSLKAGLDVVRKFGVALESEFPWDGFVTKDYEIFNRDVRRRRIMAYYNLRPRRPRVAALAARERPGARC